MDGKRPHRREDPPVRHGEAEEARAGGGARIIETAARRLSETVSTAWGIAALMAEAGPASGQRTADRAAVWEI
jgi:hypothetical protein